mgnify:CR=1 FL=1
MKKLVKVLFTASLIVSLASCGGNDKTTDAPKLENTLVKDSNITEILKKKAVMYGKADSFEGTIDPSSESFSINKVVISADMTCIADVRLCEEISSFIGGNKLIFSSSEEYALIEEESAEYRLMQKGTIKINDNTYSGTLYYSGKGDNEVGSWFKGKLIFELPKVKLLKGELLILEIKGKK